MNTSKQLQMKQCLSVILIALSSFILSCSRQGVEPDPGKANGGKLAPDGFNFETSKKVSVNIRLLSNVDEPLSGIIIDVNTTSGETLLRGVTDANGYFKSSLNLPAYIDTLSVSPNNTGLSKDVRTLIVNNSLACVLGGQHGASGNVVMALKDANKVFSATTGFATTYSYMGTFDQYGRPLGYRDPVKGAVTADLLTYLAESLPDQKDVSVHHPAYLSSTATNHLNIVKTSDVWVTFVSEGGGYTNTIGYYTYPTNNPPNNVNKINDIKYIFPNASAAGSGGTMQSGDRVKIGTFTNNTSIGFVLLQNGWKQSTNSVNPNVTKFYSYSPFNPENDANLQTHTVLLNYAKESLFIIGFEDLVRSGSTSDNDFNDVILYANSVPTDGISSAGVEGIQAPKDTDGDGVWDANDQFDDDPTKAYVSYFPSANTKGTLVFEDNWPSKGDYDMNDLVVNYQYQFVSNASNKVVEMTGKYYAVAALATNQNGFGVQFPFSSTLVKSVTGQKLSDSYITLNTNGTEAGQAKAVIIPFDNHTKMITSPYTVIDSSIVKIVFTNPVDAATLGTAPYNPFLIGQKLRGVETHLPGSTPTDLADSKFFGTQQDRTSPSSNKYYISEENWPWALSFTEQFRHPLEGYSITSAYLHFAEWASSGGTVYTDWYKNTATGYRDPAKIQ